MTNRRVEVSKAKDYIYAQQITPVKKVSRTSSRQDSLTTA